MRRTRRRRPVREGSSTCEACACPLRHADEASKAHLIFAEYGPGEHIVDQGRPTTGLHVVCAGAVMIVGVNDRGDEYGLHVVGPGNVLAMTDVLLEEKYYSITAEALTDTLVAFLRMDRFRHICNTNPMFAKGLTQASMQQVQSLERRHGELTHDSACRRLLHLLRDLTVLGGRPSVQGVRVPVPLKRSTLASLIGARPETISRLRVLLQKEGLVKFGEKETVILNPDRITKGKCCH